MERGDGCENCGEGVLTTARILCGAHEGKKFVVCPECGVSNASEVL